MVYLPPVPDNTCPDIDKVLARIDDVSKAADELASMENILEELREANDALRRNFEHQEERADGLQDELEQAQKDLADSEARAERLAEELMATRDAK